jgi:hypothetical protein
MALQQIMVMECWAIQSALLQLVPQLLLVDIRTYLRIISTGYYAGHKYNQKSSNEKAM